MKSFNEIDKKKRILFMSGVSIVLLVTLVLVYRSYAIYQESQNFNVIRGNIPNYMSDYDVRLTLTIDGKYASTIPEKNSGKTVSSIMCDKDAEGYWDYENWRIMVDFKNIRTKCQVNFVTKYTDSVLNGADPVLADGLIPVTIDENSKIYKASLENEWYNYKNKIWANAVILFDETKEYADGEEIPENNIASQFVWIPRYRYKIFNEGNYIGLTSVENRVKEIELEFESKDKTISQGSGTGQWLTHPAFTSFDVNGMWVGKFETGFKGADNVNTSQVDSSDSGNIIIKPTAYSWRGVKVSNAFIASYNYRRSMDSHMLKNTEWGAVAYLQHSVYGSQSSVRINNNELYITGCAAKVEPTCGFIGGNEACNKYESVLPGLDGQYLVNYKNQGSVVASTTGNRSGIYDMSGGAWEYVMGVMVDKNGNPVSGRNNVYNSNFIGTLTVPSDGTDKNKISWTMADGGIPFPEEKYYDKYAYGEDAEHYNRRILGDATGEMGPFANVTYGPQVRQIGSWYADDAWFVHTVNPWFARGTFYAHGLDSGMFAFSTAYGDLAASIGFRVALAF